MKKKLLFVCIIFSVLSCEALFVDDITQDAVIILAPKNNSQLESGKITFHWEKLSDTLSYQIQIATPNFENAKQILLDSLTKKNTISKELSTGEYQWRVKASNTNFSTTYTTANLTIN
ncbi:hypothetical protein [Polaribacter cellanae]|uniref:Uncharacterized protein n=1 Tax=Polaribacter cellanae TaxID=2818493 RepID=A0A975CKS5_9FLAO|nr:hypothetical protein [Polaribacter cellanae]QTE21139.1 hypothetical protein J3359_09775 [Polaribacter cellanae]